MRAVGSATCPMVVALERVIATSTGTVSQPLSLQLQQQQQRVTVPHHVLLHSPELIDLCKSMERASSACEH